MKVSLNWLKDFVDIRMELKDLVDRLTMGGLEVETAHTTGEGVEKVVVAEISTIHKHPNADRLSLVEVRTEKEKYSIVCGATNIREGQRVPLALVGARLPNGVEIKKSKIRGMTSEGMLCSEIELGLGQDATGIMILPSEASPGTELGVALGLKDAILDVSVTPNRPDCLSVIGVAREIAALAHQRLRYPPVSLSDGGEEIHQKTSVTLIDPDLCPRYVARMIEGVKIGPSPFWMKNRLEKVGVRSINNVVDVTNYVMMEQGQPLHAFDFELLEEGRIVVRRAQKGEEFVTLDGMKRVLDGEMLMICDGVKPIAIAGVMGGLNSEIRENTRIVLLESAYFSPMGNRSTSKKLGLETEAAFRFGRGVDYGACLAVANRAAELIQKLAGGRVIGGVIDAYPKPIQPAPIQLSVQRISHILGKEISAQKVSSYLEDLEVDVRREDEALLVVTPPSFRSDLEREIDLIEEVARMDGYQSIPATLPKGPPAWETRGKEYLVEKTVKEMLIHYGYYEVITYSFTSPASLDRIKLPPDDPRRRFVRIINPLTEDFSVLRTTLIPGLLETARYNLSWKNSNLRLFELKKIFLHQAGEDLPKEVKYLAGLASGFDQNIHWTSPSRAVDFYDIKGCIQDLLEAQQIRGVLFERAEDVPYLHPGNASRILWGDEVLGVLGEVHPHVLKHYEIQGKAYLFDLNFEQVVKVSGEKRRFQPLPKFPAVYRDLSVVVDEGLEVGKVTEAIWNFQQPFIDEVSLFDLYQGAPIPKGKKGVSYHIRYQATDRTLTDEEVNRYHEEVISRLRKMFGLELR
jgi:phenylalanyl-tRNA synthetase beta chain